MRSVSRDIYWTPCGGPGFEHLRVTFDQDGLRAESLVACTLDDQVYTCHYRLDTDPRYCVRELQFSLSDRDAVPLRDITLESDGQGQWRIDGESAPALAGCFDLDIQITPFTNTLPIRRLGLSAGESAEIRVAYLPVPSLAASPAEQRYTCREPLGTDGGLFLYEGLLRNFSADLAVDADGLVMDYPEIFDRSWPR